MLFRMIHLTLFVGVVLSGLQSSSSDFCGDVLSSECGICASWKRLGRCEDDSYKMWCMSTCGLCHKAQKRTILDVNYKGCYQDGFQRDFEKILPIKREVLDVKTCTMECHLKGYPYAALQNAEFCLCSKQYGRYGRADDENECLTRCAAGSEAEMCGGPWKNAVYEMAQKQVNEGPSLSLDEVEKALIHASTLNNKPQLERQAPREYPQQLNQLRDRDYYKRY